MHTILSIGLNERGAKSERPGALWRTLAELRSHGMFPVAVAMIAGEWDGVPERTLHVAVNGFADPRTLESLAAALHQECVAAVVPGAARWTLYYANGARDAGGDLVQYPVAIARELIEWAPQ